ncbi:formate/nitrite transporter family protein [Polyangium sp. y55x31]|uniref:formate/nitrite transporter family protein n=1 Tax=Polyangium sp. y55x31 TaxID=3042688 RepID=UPI0024826F32|nr:formate/nitrite transporter family protein [Polyangium sp. y55x31]MDI1477647.1 formate/nitrite transporter family protein [Polyangium sp. y55x31]
MDYVAPSKVVSTMLDAGAAKAAASLRDLVIRGFLAGALLGFATSLAVTTTVQTTIPVAGALLFPVGFVMIVLLGLELVTGNFALLPMAMLDKRATLFQLLRNFGVVFSANLAGSLFYAWLLSISLTMAGSVPPDAVANKIVAIAQAKTQFPQYGLAGLLGVFVRSILCNWMVCLGVVMAMTSTSTVGKIAAAWLPILVFFAHGYEHSVVNMFVIPAGMMLGAKVTFADWWLKNQLPVTAGNFVGGFLFTGMALYFTHKPKPDAAGAQASPAPPDLAAPAPPPAPALVLVPEPPVLELLTSEPEPTSEREPSAATDSA